MRIVDRTRLKSRWERSRYRRLVHKLTKDVHVVHELDGIVIPENTLRLARLFVQRMKLLLDDERAFVPSGMERYSVSNALDDFAGAMWLLHTYDVVERLEREGSRKSKSRMANMFWTTSWNQLYVTWLLDVDYNGKNPGCALAAAGSIGDVDDERLPAFVALYEMNRLGWANNNRKLDWKWAKTDAKIQSRLRAVGKYLQVANIQRTIRNLKRKEGM